MVDMPDVPMYFEHPVAEHDLMPIGETELYVASAICRGRTMIATPHPLVNDTVPAMEDYPLPPEDELEEQYTDALSDLMQAAEHSGLNVDELIEAARTAQRRELAEGVQMAHALRSGEALTASALSDRS